jgi:hypothetical protein
MTRRTFTLDPRSDKLIMGYPRGLRSLVVRAAILQFSLSEVLQFSLSEASRKYSSPRRTPEQTVLPYTGLDVDNDPS